jgi:hypothetical protein
METKVNDAEVASREKERALFESLKQASESAKSEHSDASNATTMAEMQVNFTKSLLAKAKQESQSSKVKATTLAEKIQSLEEDQQASQDKKAALKREAALAKMENNTALLKSKKEEIKRIDADLKALDAKIAANKEDKAAAEQKTKELDEAQRRLKLASVFLKSFKPLLGNISKVANKSAILFNESQVADQKARNASDAAEMFQDKLGKALSTPGAGINATEMRSRLEQLLSAAKDMNMSASKVRNQFDKAKKLLNAAKVFAVPVSADKKLADVVSSLKADGHHNCTETIPGTGSIVAHIMPLEAKAAGIFWRAVGIDKAGEGIVTRWRESAEEVCNLEPALYRVEFKQTGRPVWKQPRLSADVEIPVEANAFSVVSREFYQNDMAISVAANPEQEGSFLDVTSA